jgi:hypothetical protein
MIIKLPIKFAMVTMGDFRGAPASMKRGGIMPRYRGFIAIEPVGDLAETA